MSKGAEILKSIRHRMPGAYRAYWESLGRFVSKFASVEATMQHSLCWFAGVRWELAPAIFSGVRAAEATSLITRISETEKWEPAVRAELKDVLDQFKRITKARNQILHYGANFDRNDQIVVSNIRAAHIPERLELMVISPELLDAMTEDLGKIALHLSVLMGPTDLARKMLAGTLSAAWQYKLPEPPKKAAGGRGRAPRKERDSLRRTQRKASPPKS